MAGIVWEAIPSAVIASGTSKKTVLQVIAPTNQRLTILEWWIDFQGADPVGTPVLVELLEQSTAGSGGSSLTVTTGDSSTDETLQTTALHTITSEPTTVKARYRKLIHPQEGVHIIRPFDRPIEVPGGKRLGIAVTAAATVNCMPGMIGRE